MAAKKKKTLKVKCKCIATLNTALEPMNGELDLMHFLFNGVSLIQVAVVKKDTKNRMKPARVCATFCPFCGVKYPELSA